MSDPTMSTIFWIFIGISAGLMVKMYLMSSRAMSVAIEQYKNSQSFGALCQSVSMDGKTYADIMKTNLEILTSGKSPEDNLAAWEEMMATTKSFGYAMSASLACVKKEATTAHLICSEEGRILTPKEATEWLVKQSEAKAE